MSRLLQTIRGAITVGRRRGLRYGWYLASGVYWPQLAHRWLWGPEAPSLLRRFFDATSPMAGRRAGGEELRRAGLLTMPSSRQSDALTIQPSDLDAFLDRAHAQHIAGLGPALDSAVLTAEGVQLTIVPPEVRVYRRRGLHFHAARDSDREMANRRFGATLLTEVEARRALRTIKGTVRRGYRDYSPIDFGGGLTIGQIASTDSGTGRWDFFNGRIVAPIVAGKRVLDLGCNNGALPLMMLRAGAREVVAIEFDPAIADFARLNARILAWRDIRQYQIQVLTGDMRQFLDDSLGHFDVVTAFCSLYYLPEEDMARLIARAARIGATLILQANDAIRNLPAQTERLHVMMRDNGFPDVQVHAWPGFARPLLVGAPSTREMREYAGSLARLTTAQP